MYAENRGVKIWYEVHGHGEPTLVMVHGFQICHSEAFKRSYVPFLSRHVRVVTLDLRGNGKSDKPDGGYDLQTYVEDLDAVVQAAGLDRFAMVGHSLGVPILIKYNTTHPKRVSHLFFLSGFARLFSNDDDPRGLPRQLLDGALTSWRCQPESMLKTFIETLCQERHTERAKELIWQWAHETSPEIWAACAAPGLFSDVTDCLENIDVPVLIVHGQKDKTVYPMASQYLHEKIPDSKLLIVSEAGHLFWRTWPQVSWEILEVLKPAVAKSLFQACRPLGKSILWISSPIGLGHVTRDLAIAREVRRERPHVTVHWLAAEPVRSFLRSAGEVVHPLSEALRDESGHLESRASDYCLNLTEAYWEMDRHLNNNFMVFSEAARSHEYDLVVGDESWEIDDFLHANPSLKTAPYAFVTDFVGASNVGEDQIEHAHVRSINEVWVENRRRNPGVCDLSIFIGNVEDIPDGPFGEGLPNRREWAKGYFEFVGYVLPFDPAPYLDRHAVREKAGFSEEDRIVLVAVGGTSVGQPLIKKCLQAHALLRDRISRLRTVVLCGPRIDPDSFERPAGVELRSLVADPIDLYAACDLAVIQGGLSTAMELTVLGRPFLYFPLMEHFEQQEFVPNRLERHRAGIRMDFVRTTPDQLAKAIRNNIGTSTDYMPVETDGAKKTAGLMVKLLGA
jgi:pimeloyl-ACP methyl ester carboxylesterase/predicted glycosyltransferase